MLRLPLVPLWCGLRFCLMLYPRAALTRFYPRMPRDLKCRRQIIFSPTKNAIPFWRSQPANKNTNKNIWL